MVSQKFLAFAKDYSSSHGLFDPESFRVEDDIDIAPYSDEELSELLPDSIEIESDDEIKPYSEDEIEERLRALLKRKRPQSKAASVYELAQLFSIAAGSFDPAVEGLVNYINGMEKAFLEAREGTDNPLAKVILTGMWQDFLNFKHKNWKDSFQMLAQRAREVALTS